MTASPVLVGFDGSDESHDSLALGRELAGALGARLVVGGVLDYFPEEPMTTSVDSFEGAIAEDRDRLAGQLGELLPQGEYEFDAVLALSAAHGLEVLADDHGAEIIVVGSTHRGPVGRVTFGSMAERLLSGCTKAVAVAPRGFAGEAELRRIGVAYDGSPEARSALDFAAGIAAATHARLALIHALEPWPLRAPAVPGAPIPAIEQPEQLEARKRAAEKGLEQALDRIGPELDATATAELGRPDEFLVSRSETLDLLVLGSRGYGPVRRVLLGSVSSKVARASHCPVLVVPRAEGEGAETRHRVLRATGEVVGADVSAGSPAPRR